MQARVPVSIRQWIHLRNKPAICLRLFPEVSQQGRHRFWNVVANPGFLHPAVLLILEFQRYNRRVYKGNLMFYTRLDELILGCPLKISQEGSAALLYVIQTAHKGEAHLRSVYLVSIFTGEGGLTGEIKRLISNQLSAALQFVSVLMICGCSRDTTGNAFTLHLFPDLINPYPCGKVIEIAGGIIPG